ncbi:hypothetical protein ABZT17_10135 [Streptomyces sp. NPDC005648]|uniref:hypothetical protein n=1 Tax=Streptomyces sp. NPDC005648 TaxID=3157044 RepID=UPI0033BF89F4
MDAHLDLMRAHPDIAGRVLRLEYTSVSLNPQARLFGRRSLLEQFDPGRAADRPVLAAFKEKLACPWALYHVSPDPARREGGADPAQAGDALGGASRRGPGIHSRPEAAERLGAARRPPVEVDARSGRVRAWIQQRGPELPTVEELMVTAPFHVRDKKVPHFERKWAAHRGSRS